ncbi:MAG: hypothetical protein JW732_07175 [Dehalococcoidia bacterium]|nr:hypothetical protein [Dehalococcoidia bacterium]
MQAKQKLEHELADVLVKMDKTEKRLKRLRRTPTDVPKGRIGVSFVAARNQMAEAEEVTKELDDLKRRELEIRSKLQLHSE